MEDLATELVQLMRHNRMRHGKAWRKVRLDRIHKLFPFTAPDDVADAIWQAVDAGIIEWTLIADEHMPPVLPFEKCGYVDGIKLVKFAYPKGRWGY